MYEQAELCTALGAIASHLNDQVTQLLDAVDSPSRLRLIREIQNDAHHLGSIAEEHARPEETDFFTPEDLFS